MKNRQYQGVQLSKKESELVQWLQKGEHSWFDAFYVYEGRRKGRFNGRTNGTLKERSWFNSTLRSLRDKGLCENIPFIYGGILWRNPGITASKASFVALSIQTVNHEQSKTKVI